MTFGVLTLATQNDYPKAIGLALSLRVSNPGVPIAVACRKELAPILSPHFDHVIEKRPDLTGFYHKVHLDHYSPFDETFFFDSDVLVFRPLDEVLGDWRPQEYTACGIYASTNYSSFGLDRARVLAKIQRPRLVQIDGAGHAYFRKPDCKRVFDLAREITAEYESYAGSIKYADEDAMDIAMTLLDLKPMDGSEFFSRHLSARRGSLKMDACAGFCEFEAVTTGRLQRPHMMHFAAREAPIPYAKQLVSLHNKFGVNTSGIFPMTFRDIYDGQIMRPIKKSIRKLITGNSWKTLG